MHGHECYAVCFSDGTEIVADADHLWQTTTRRPEGTTALRTTKEIADSLLYDPKKNERNHRIPVAGPLEGKDADLPIGPYTLGAWLGDGDSDCARLTYAMADAEIRDIIQHCGTAVGEAKHDNRSRDTCRARLGGDRRHDRSLQSVLRKCGLLKNKHIPGAYLRAPSDQRMALMCGLMDTDGYVSRSGQCEFTTTSPRLRDGFLELARSLGYKPTLKTAPATISGKVVGEKYRIQFRAYADRPVFRLRRKRARLSQAPACRSRSQTRQIVDVRPVPSVPVRCIAVDSASHLYLAGEGMIPTHNTPLAAGILNYVLFCDNEPGAQIYGAAADIPQASLLFRHAAGMIAREPELSSRCTVYDSYRSVVLNQDKGSTYKVISGEAKGKHGQNSHFVIVDELHEQPDRDLVDTLATSFASANRKQPLLAYATTAGWDRHSICYEVYQRAKRVQEGVSRDAAFLPVIFEADEGDDWTDESVWAKANPNLGVSVSLDYLRRECQKAKENPSYENTFRQLHLNQWTEQAVRWLPMDRWDACPQVLPDLAGRPCFAGLDLSSTRDITALVLCFPLDGGEFALKGWFWVPTDSAHVRERQDRVPYVAWSREGLVTLTQGNVVDYSAVIAQIKQIDAEYSLQGIAVDPWNATGVLTQLEADGYNVVQFRQGYASMSGPAKQLEKCVVSGKLNHGGNPVLRWMAGNVTIDTDPAGNIKPSKAKSTERIDGIVAGIMALGLAVTQDTSESVYETQGLVWL